MTDEDGGWQIEARWWGSYGEQTGGPREVVIRADPAADAVPIRGITSGVFRRMERLLGPLIADVQATPASLQAEQEYREKLGLRAQALPAGGPRSAPHDYYEALLALFEELESTRPAPHKDLAEAMGVPRETVKTRLRIARQRREAARNRAD